MVTLGSGAGMYSLPVQRPTDLWQSKLASKDFRTATHSKSTIFEKIAPGKRGIAFERMQTTLGEMPYATTACDVSEWKGGKDHVALGGVDVDAQAATVAENLGRHATAREAVGKTQQGRKCLQPDRPKVSAAISFTGVAWHCKDGGFFPRTRQTDRFPNLVRKRPFNVG
jgi:hypothetical protein